MLFSQLVYIQSTLRKSWQLLSDLQVAKNIAEISICLGCNFPLSSPFQLLSTFVVPLSFVVTCCLFASFLWNGKGTFLLYSPRTGIFSIGHLTCQYGCVLGDRFWSMNGLQDGLDLYQILFQLPKVVRLFVKIAWSFSRYVLHARMSSIVVVTFKHSLLAGMFAFRCFNMWWINISCAWLQLLSEEVFDFSRGELTQSKIKELKNSLNRCGFLLTGHLDSICFWDKHSEGCMVHIFG